MIDLPINQIICGDCLAEVMKDWPDNCIDTVITDPPYGLEFMGKEWDKFGISQTRAKRLTQTEKKVGDPKYDYMQGKGRYSEMTVKEKSAMQEFFYQWAIEVLRIAKPGAFLLCFGGTRTYHRLACAIEDAGWQIRDCIMWLYGSGFPKSLDISKAIDKAKGAERKVIANRRGVTKIFNVGAIETIKLRDPITSPTTNLAKLWDGWGTALKPAWEPIIVAMKPIEGTFAENAEKYGVAGLNIDDSRISYSKGKPESGWSKSGSNGSKGYQGTDTFKIRQMSADEIQQRVSQDRWPANVILDEEVAMMLDEQSGELQSGDNCRRTKSGNFLEHGGLGKAGDLQTTYGDSGGASRFFYCAKASRSERNMGLEGMEVKSKIGFNTSPREYDGKIHGEIKLQNNHPTVKPLALMEYLCKLTQTPTGGLVLDPFGGSGTTALACVNTNRNYILIEKEYCEIARQRVKTRIKVRNTGVPVKEARQGQMALFETPPLGEAGLKR